MRPYLPTVEHTEAVAYAGGEGVQPPGSVSETQLLEVLRRCAGAPGLRYTAPPVRVTGGFWAEILAIAERRGLSLNALVGEIDHARAPGSASPGNLSSALRLHVLDDLRKRTISRV